MPWVEQRIKELAQLSAGKTAVDDDLGRNALQSSLAVVACIRYASTCSRALGGWPSRSCCASGCSGFPRSSPPMGASYLQLLRGEPNRLRFLAALRGLNHDNPPPVPA